MGQLCLKTTKTERIHQTKVLFLKMILLVMVFLYRRGQIRSNKQLL